MHLAELCPRYRSAELAMSGSMASAARQGREPGPRRVGAIMPTLILAKVALLQSVLDRAHRTIGHGRGLVVGVGLRRGQLVQPDSGPSARSIRGSAALCDEAHRVGAERRTSSSRSMPPGVMCRA